MTAILSHFMAGDLMQDNLGDYHVKVASLLLLLIAYGHLNCEVIIRKLIWHISMFLWVSKWAGMCVYVYVCAHARACVYAHCIHSSVHSCHKDHVNHCCEQTFMSWV